MTRKRDPRPKDQAQTTALLEAVVEGVTDAIFVKDRRGRYLMINAAGARYVGKSVAEVVGKDDTAFFAPETAVSFIETDRTIMATGETQTREVKVATAAGKISTYLTTKGPYRDAAGEVVGILGIARDVTESKALAEERDRLLARLRLHVERLPLAYVSMDSRHRVLDWNPAAERMFGYQKEEALGRVGFELLDARPRRRIVAVLRQVETGAMDAHAVNRNRTKDGRIITCDWFNTPLMDSSGTFTGTISLAQDVTERTRTEAERERLHRAMAASRNQLRALSHQLLEAQEVERRNVARELHDEIGQILTAVSISLSRAKSVAGRRAQHRLDESLAIVNQAIQQVRALTLDLHPPMLDDLGLVAALRWYLARQQERASCQIVFTAPPGQLLFRPEVNVACFRVVQEAVTNVLRHARAEHLWVELRSDEEDVQITIRDDGVGFDPVEARQNATNGRSFGLLSMEERVLRLDGRFEIESSPKRGAEIRVCLAHIGRAIPAHG